MCLPESAPSTCREMIHADTVKYYYSKQKVTEQERKSNERQSERQKERQFSTKKKKKAHD